MNTLQHRNGWVEFDLDFQHWILQRHKLLKLAKGNKGSGNLVPRLCSTLHGMGTRLG